MSPRCGQQLPQAGSTPLTAAWTQLAHARYLPGGQLQQQQGRGCWRQQQQDELPSLLLLLQAPQLHCPQKCGAP